MDAPPLAAIVANGEPDLVHRHRHRQDVLAEIGQIVGSEV
jgi:hypothetical protein